jgi:hypothetical protein
MAFDYLKALQRNILVVNGGPEWAQVRSEAEFRSCNVTPSDDGSGGFTVEVDLGPEWALVPTGAGREKLWRDQFKVRHEQTPLDYQAFLDEIVSLEGDRRWFAMRVLADKLEEAGSPNLGYTWRWMAQNQVFPDRNPENGRWVWVRLIEVEDEIMPGMEPVPNMPAFIANALDPGDSLAEAVLMLCATMQRMRIDLSVEDFAFPPLG